MSSLIYVIEDDPAIKEVIEIVLNEDGHTIKTFLRAGLFKSALDELLPDLILTDILLPDGDGRQICKMIKSNAVTAEIR